MDEELYSIARKFYYNDKSKEMLLNSTKILLRRKDIDVNVKNENGWTPLTYAACYHGNDTRFVELLLKHPEIDVNSVDDQGETPLINAVYNVVNGNSSFAIVKMLLAHPNIDPNLRAMFSQSALWIAGIHGDNATYRAVLMHPKTQLFWKGAIVEFILLKCQDSKDYGPKLLTTINCPKVSFMKLWDFGLWNINKGITGRIALMTLCNVLNSNKIKTIYVPAIKRFSHTKETIFKKILNGIQKCKSLRSVIVADRNKTEGYKLIYEAITSNLSITYITRSASSGIAPFPLDIHRENVHLQANKLAHQKRHEATIFVLLAFKKLVNKDVARMIAKLVWASGGTGVWHEEGYISLGEKRRVERLSPEINIELLKYQTRHILD